MDQIKKSDKPGLTTGAAPIPVETLLYFQSLDLVIAELFGCTESMGPQTTNMSGKYLLLYNIYTICWYTV